MTYDDGVIACTDEALVIRRYYFPTGSKRIPYVKIARVQRVALAAIGGRYRIWGSSDFSHWFNLDSGRPDKSVAFIIEVNGSQIRPVITPQDPDGVAAEFAAHGLRVTDG